MEGREMEVNLRTEVCDNNMIGLVKAIVEKWQSESREIPHEMGSCRDCSRAA